MSAVAEETQPWSRTRWTLSISLVVAVQLVLVLLFTQRSPLVRKSTPDTPVSLPPGLSEDFQALTDPTLLALGGPRGFSALWLDPTNLPPLETEWKQPPRWLSIETQALGAEFLDWARSNRVSLHGLRFKSTPQVLGTTQLSTTQPLRTHSTLRVLGDLAHRTPLQMPDLPSRPATDLLPPSEVRVLVDARGRVVSAILQSSSGSADADRYALTQAQQMRFTPAAQGVTGEPLTFGRLLFEWHTAPSADSTDPEK